MKINISCKSPILQKTLDSYLRDYVASYDDCDFVIADEIFDTAKPICLATFREDSNIKRPMHRDSLFGDLERFYKQIPSSQKNGSQKNVLDTRELASLRESVDSINGDPLKEQIDSIFSDFANKLYTILKKHDK